MTRTALARILLRQAARWTTAAEQDEAPSIAVLHANYGVAWIDALRSVMRDEEVKRLTGIDPWEVREIALAAQDKAALALARRCPHVVPQGPLVALAKEGFGAVAPLDSLHPEFRWKVTTLLQRVGRRVDGRGKPWLPKLYYGWRSPEVQADLYARGKSDVKFSYHNVVDPSGNPKALAADIIDRRYAWDLEDRETAWTTAQRDRFWKVLGEEAEALELTWGGRWTNLYDPAHVQLYSTGDPALAQLAKGKWPPPNIPHRMALLNQGALV